MGFLKGAVIFVLGVGAGASGSYIYFKKKYNDKKEELDELKEYFYVKVNAKDEKEVAETIIKKQSYIPYDTVKTTVEKPVEVVDSPPEDYPEEPIVITEEDYSERELSFEKFEADYYVGDNTLVDENEEIMNIEDIVGYEKIEEFVADESEDVLYIRNASSGSDYMIKKVFGNYSDIIGVGGDDEDD